MKIGKMKMSYRTLRLREWVSDKEWKELEKIESDFHAAVSKKGELEENFDFRNAFYSLHVMLHRDRHMSIKEDI